jgi:hypothetical protein
MTSSSTPTSQPLALLARPLAALDALVGALDRALRHRTVWGAACLLLLAGQLLLILTHEPWRDEWQAVQIAVQSPTIRDLLDNLRYEGHPPLWYLLLRSASSIVGPHAVLATILALIAIVGQLLILAAAPFSRAERLLLGMSEFLFFEYFSISRSLSLGVLFVLLAVALRRHRAGWIPIALLPLCDFQFGVMSLGLAILRWRDKRLWAPGLCIWLGLGLLAAWSVRPATDLVPPGVVRGLSIEAASFLHRLGTALVPLQWDGGLRWDSPPPGILAPFAGIGFLIFAWCQTAHDRLHRALLIGFIAICAIFTMTVYSLSVRHIMLCTIVLIALRWEAAQAAGGQRGWRVWLLVAAVCGVATSAVSLTMPFDTTGRVAAAIEREGLTKEPWMSFPSEHAQGVAALTGIGFEKPEKPCWQSFIHWNEKHRMDNPDTIADALFAGIERHGSFYLLSGQEIDLPEVSMREIEAFPAGFNKQSYFLYEIAPGMPKTGARVPPCVAAQRPLTGD